MRLQIASSTLWIARSHPNVGASGPSSFACSSTCLQCRRHLHKTSSISAGRKSHYDSLKLPKNATKSQIKSQFYALSKKTHPDAPGGDADKFHEINEAYHVLGNESARRSYDQSLHPAPSPSASYGSRPPGYGYASYAQPGYTTQRGSTTGGTYWSGRNRPPPPPGGDYNAYSPFGRHTPPQYGGASSSTYGAGPKWTHPSDQTDSSSRSGQGAGEGPIYGADRDWGRAGFGAGMGSAFDSAKQENERYRRRTETRPGDWGGAGRFFLLTVPFVVVFALAGQFTVRADEKSAMDQVWASMTEEPPDGARRNGD